MNKSIYGLKQAPKNWYQLLNKTLIKLKFKPLLSEPCIYIFTRENGDKYYMFVYVDDTLLAGKDLAFINMLVKLIQKEHGVKILGEPKFILGLKLTRCLNGDILVDQNQYIKDVAARFNITSNEANPVRMPCTTSQFKRIEHESTDPSLIDLSIDIRTMVGSLMYASLGTRLDITYFVNYISRYLTKPTKYIEKIVRQSIAYLLDTPFIFLICFADYKTSPQLTAFCDASHGSELNRKGTSGGIVKLGHTCIIWYSTKQSTFSLSTAETEYKALSNIGKEVIYATQLVEEIGLSQILPTVIYEDNTATIAMTDNPIINKKSKHIELQYHQFKSLVQDKKVKLLYVATKFQQADILTKVLATFEDHYRLIKQTYNLEGITSPNVTLMLKGIKETDLSLELQTELNYKHIKTLNHAYVNSDEYEKVESDLWATTNNTTQIFMLNVKTFYFKHLLMHASVLSYLVTKDAKQFSKFFPIVLEVNNVYHDIYKTNFNDYITQLQIMMKLVNTIRCAATHFKYEQQYDNMLLNYEMVNHYKMINVNNCLMQQKNFVHMIRTANITNDDKIKHWLENDIEYIEDISRFDSLNEEDKEILSEIATNAAMKRFDNTERIKSMSYKEKMEYLIQNDNNYLRQIEAYNNMTNLQDDEIHVLCEKARLKTLISLDAKYKSQHSMSLNNSSSLTLSSIDSRKTKLASYDNKTNKESHDNSSDNNISKNKSASNQFVTKSITSHIATASQANKSTFYSLTDQERQTLYEKKESKANKKPKFEKGKVNKNKLKMTEQEKDQFIRMVAESNSSFYHNILQAMKLTNKMISKEAIDVKNDDESDNEEGSYEYESDNDYEDDDDGEIQANVSSNQYHLNNDNNNKDNSIHNNNNNNDDDNIEDTAESMIATNRSHLKSRKVIKTNFNSSSLPNPEVTVETSRRSTRKLPSKVSKELKKGGANYRVN